MKFIIFSIVFALLRSESEGQFEPEIRVLGNIVMSIGNHLFARFTDDEVPPGSENGTFIEQVGYIHQMLLKMRDYFVNPPDYLQDQLKDLAKSFSLQVKVQLPKLNITEEDLRSKFHLKDDQINRFHSMATDCVKFVDEIIETRGEEVPDY